MATPTETEDINDCPINKLHLNFILLILQNAQFDQHVLDVKGRNLPPIF